jgi:hypothetical protein
LTAYPVRTNGMERADKRFEMLARDMGLVAEQHGYDRLTAEERAEFEKRLFEFFHGSRGAAGELEKRLNGTAAPLVKEGGELDSYDCLAVCHELRRVRGAEGALVIAMRSDSELTIGLAADEGSMMDVVGNELIDALSAVIEKRGWKAPTVKDVGMEFVVDKEGGLKS